MRQTPRLDPTWVYLLVAAVGTIHAVVLRWVCDDAYISFRYAENFVAGHGLVFNPGERVEGYTNFAWTMLLAFGSMLGIATPGLSLILGVVCTALGYLCWWRVHRLLFGVTLWPMALIALAANYSFASFGTSGLETPMVILLNGAAWWLVLEWRGAIQRPCAALESVVPTDKTRFHRGLLVAVGAIVGWAAMTRPDAALLGGGIVLAVGLGSRQKAHDLAFLVGAMALVYGPFLLWRYSYYGSFVPNTYYAKAAYLPHWEQGWKYLAEFAQRYFLWVWLPFAVLGAWCYGVEADRRLRIGSVRAGMLALCVVHVLYVVRVGGDFMEGRFFVAVLPLYYLLAESGLRVIIGRFGYGVVPTAIATLAMGATAIGKEVIARGQIQDGITDERAWQPTVKRWLVEGEVLGRKLPAGTLVATDSLGAFGWASKLPIIDLLGLTDATVAHQPLERRVRPGHEKFAELAYLQERKVALIRDGMGIVRQIYGNTNPPQLQLGGSRYYATKDTPAMREALTALRDASSGR